MEPGKRPVQSGVCPEGGEADEGLSGDGFFSGLSGDEKEGSHPRRRGSGRRRGQRQRVSLGDLPTLAGLPGLGHADNTLRTNNSLSLGRLLFHCGVCCVSCSVVSDCDPMDCSPAGSSVLGILQARILGWVAIPSSRGLLNQVWNPGLLRCRQSLHRLSHQEVPFHWGL